MQSNQNIPENANDHCPGANSDQAGKSDACAGCPNQQLCQSGAGKQLLDNSEIIANLKQVKHKILVLSGKGGVGKSTVSSQLAHILASKGFDVGLLDIDICGPSIPRMMGLESSEVHSSNNGWQPIYINENLGVMSIGFLIDNKDEAIIWRGPRKNGLIKQFLTDVAWGELDFLIIDTPPGTSDEHISIVQYLNLTPDDGAVIVTTPQEVSLSDVRKEISFCQKTKTNILGVIENMSGFVCPNCQHHTDTDRQNKISIIILKLNKFTNKNNQLQSKKLGFTISFYLPLEEGINYANSILSNLLGKYCHFTILLVLVYLFEQYHSNQKCYYQLKKVNAFMKLLLTRLLPKFIQTLFNVQFIISFSIIRNIK